MTRIRYKEIPLGFISTHWLLAGKHMVRVFLSRDGLRANIVSDANRVIKHIKGTSKRITMRKVKETLQELGVVVYDEVRNVRKR